MAGVPCRVRIELDRAMPMGQASGAVLGREDHQARSDHQPARRAAQGFLGEGDPIQRFR
jgi:hypothetical protein